MLAGTQVLDAGGKLPIGNGVEKSTEGEGYSARQGGIGLCHGMVLMVAAEAALWGPQGLGRGQAGLGWRALRRSSRRGAGVLPCALQRSQGVMQHLPGKAARFTGNPPAARQGFLLRRNITHFIGFRDGTTGKWC